MEFSLGYVKSDNQFLLTEYKINSPVSSKILGLEELKDVPLHGLLCDLENISENTKEILHQEQLFYPIGNAKDLGLNYEKFETSNFEFAENTCLKLRESWVLRNNINLFNNLFPTLKRLKSLWPNDRTGFFEELWFLVKSNLAASSLSLIYNDIENSGEEKEKNKLIKVKVEGFRIPNPVQGTEIENALVKHFENDFSPTFNIVEYEKDKNRLVATVTLKGSPVLIMANVPEISTLQKSAMNLLFDGLNNSI